MTNITRGDPLEAAGGTLDDVVSIVVYTTDIRQFKEIVAARTGTSSLARRPGSHVT